MRINMEPPKRESRNLELIDTLIAISVVSRRLAAKLTMEMEAKANGKNERAVAGSR